MRKSALVAMAVLCVGVLAACEEADDLTGVNSCTGLNGFYTASSFTATGIDNNQLQHNLLALGGSFTINFGSGNFTSNFRQQTGSDPITRQGAFSLQNGTITMGNQTLFTGAPAGTQLFTCTANGKSLTLIAQNSSYMFPTETTAARARINIVLSKP